MNLVDFYVTKILEEKRGLAYELYGMTKEQAEAEEAEHPFLARRAFSSGSKANL